MPASAYQINQPVHEAHRRRYRRRMRFLVTILLAIAVAVAILGYEFFHVNHAGEKSNIGATFTQHIAGPQTFTSSYFQFSDTSKWQYAANDSTANKLTYLSYEGGVPVHSLTVYVNQVPLQSDLAVMRTLPVKIVNGNSFSLAGDISPPCSSLYKATDRQVIKSVSLSGTMFICVPDSPQFTVIVGQVGSDYNLMLRRKDGAQARYIIIYHNLSINPDPAAFVRIMKTFEAL